MKFFKSIVNFFELVLTGKGTWAEDAIAAGAVDYGGQGRDSRGQ